METNCEVELCKVLGPTSLSAGKDFCGGKVLEILVICKNVDQNTGTFEIVSPYSEGFKDS